MMTSAIWNAVIGVAVTLLVLWVGLIIALLILRPRGWRLREALRLLPDVLRLVKRLAGDTHVPRGVRLRLWLLLAYLAFPIDLIPDVIPVLGYADDVIIVIAVLRSVIRRAGLEAVRSHWPGSDEGFAVLLMVTGEAGGRGRSSGSASDHR